MPNTPRKPATADVPSRAASRAADGTAVVAPSGPVAAGSGRSGPRRTRRSAPPVTPVVAEPGPPVIDIYARLSYSVDGSEIKVDDQTEMCTEKIAARRARVGEVFKDNSKSAWKPGVVRPEWEELMTRLESGASDGVMVYDLTRFSRKVKEGERLVDAANKGILVWSMSGEYDLTTADGRRHFRESMVAAAAESDKISERTKRGKLRRARKGRASGGSRGFAMPGLLPKPPGWERGDPREQVPDAQVETEREIVHECYRRLFAGESVQILARDLNTRAVEGELGTAPTLGQYWSRGTLSKSLQRASLAGLLEHNGDVIGDLFGAEPVVTREDWQRVKALLAARPLGRPFGPRFLLSGILRCAECGRPMMTRPRPQLDVDGLPKREYRCFPNNDLPKVDPRRGCGRNIIVSRVADEAIHAAIVERLGDPRRADRIAAQLTHASQERARIEGEIGRWEASADELATKTAMWGVARVDAAMAPILRAIDDLREELTTLELPSTTTAATADAVATWTDAVAQGDFAAQRALIRQAFPRIAVIRPRWHNDHGAERILWDGPQATATGDSPQ